MIYIYEKYFKEMGYSQQKIEDIITGNFEQLILYWIKIQLTKKEFGDKYIFKGVSDYAKKSIWNWMLTLDKHIKIIFQQLEENNIVSPKNATKEKAYLSVLENMKVWDYRYDNEIKNSFKKWSDYDKFEKYFEIFILNKSFDEFDFYKQLLDFLFTIKPNKNQVMKKEEVLNKFHNWLKEMGFGDYLSENNPLKKNY